MTDPTTILLVEDNPDDILFWEMASSKAGLKSVVRVVRDGVEALDYLTAIPPYDDRMRHPRPTHVILDLKLPRKSGLEVLEWIREHREYRDLPVIVLTSSEEKSDVARARQLGVTAYLVKPVSLPELVDLVRTIGERWNLELGASA